MRTFALAVIAITLIPNPETFHWWHIVMRIIALTIVYTAGRLDERRVI